MGAEQTDIFVGDMSRDEVKAFLNGKESGSAGDFWKNYRDKVDRQMERLKQGKAKWAKSGSYADHPSGGSINHQPSKKDALNFHWSFTNGKLMADKIASFNLPAGETCEGARTCMVYCYAVRGLLKFDDNVRPRTFNYYRLLQIHQKHGQKGVADAFAADMKYIIGKLKWRGIRFHDSGDFFEAWYMDAVIAAAKRLRAAHKKAWVYAYTKRIDLIHKKGRYPKKNPPVQFNQSDGGKYDDQIDPRFTTVEIKGQDEVADHVVKKGSKVILGKRVPIYLWDGKPGHIVCGKFQYRGKDVSTGELAIKGADVIYLPIHGVKSSQLGWLQLAALVMVPIIAIMAWQKGQANA